jgi:hypothetical protein
MLLADRAARNYDGEAVQKADAILSGLAGMLCILGWRGADVFQNEDRLRAQASKAGAARKKKPASERRLIHDALERLRAAGAPKRGAPKQAAAVLIKTCPTLSAAKFANLARRCQIVASEDFPEWGPGKRSKKEKANDP